MRQLQSVLFASNFRLGNDPVREVAVHLARAFGARITILHVLEPLPNWHPMLAQLEREHAATQMRRVAAQLEEQGVILDESSILVGQAADTIVRKAEEMDADLILVGTGSQGSGESHPYLGPTAEAVLQRATTPVLAIRPGEPAAHFQNILCPVDQSPASARGLLVAIRLAHTFGGSLTVLSVIPPASWLSLALETGQLREAQQEHERRWQQEFELFLKASQFSGVRWRKAVRRGVPDEEIVAAAREDGADLIVMGSTGHTGLAHILMGSVTRRVIHKLPCSILTARHHESADDQFLQESRVIQLLFAEGQSLFDDKAYPTALEKFLQVLARNPYHAAALEARAATLEKLGRSHEAERSRQRAEILRAEPSA